MRYVVVLLLGAFIGAMLTVTALNVLREGNALPRGLMAVMDYRMEKVRTRIANEQCEGAEIDFRTIELLGADIVPAFSPLAANEVLFTQYADDLQTRANLAASHPAPDCRALKEQIGQVADGCKACHRDFK